MMFSRFLVVGLASLALACGIALVFYKVLGASAETRKVKTRDVVVASVELPVGARIRPADVRIVTVPEGLAPQNCFALADEVKDRVVTNLILKDEPVVPNRLAARGSGAGLAPMIPAGYRAVSVRVNDVIGVAGFIQPGMRVDVLASGRLPNTEDSVTRTVLQNVVVLSAGQVLQPEPKGQVINAQVVTLQVRPEEAEILTLTSGEGRIQLVLRNSSDNALAATPGAHLAAIYNVGASAGKAASQKADSAPVISRHSEKPPAASLPKPAAPSSPPPPRPEPPRSIEVIRGTTRSDVTTSGGTATREAGPEEPGKKTATENSTEKKKLTRRLYALDCIA
jgi:pilus assembly protein CpaB